MDPDQIGDTRRKKKPFRKTDHGTRNCGYNCQGCTDMRKKYKQDKKKRERMARKQNTETKKQINPMPLATEGQHGGVPYNDHMAVSERKRTAFLERQDEIDRQREALYSDE